MMRVSKGSPVLEVCGLITKLRSRAGEVTVVDRLDLTLRAGETLAIVGESGSGKSMTALSIMRLLPEPAAFNGGGQILFGGVDLLKIPEREMRKIRGGAISMIFQEPMTCLNPVLKIGLQIEEALREHRPELDRSAMRRRALELLRQVKITDPDRVYATFPHLLSGGMRQRVMIAIALACEPQILIADEPTTALDATVQVQILDLLRDLQEELGLAILLITHNLGVVATNADRVMVLYAGRKFEEADVRELFKRPAHPYTKGLLAALPSHGHVSAGERVPLREIPGRVPPLSDLPPGCVFAPRCPVVMPLCSVRPPALDLSVHNHATACFAATALVEDAA